MQDKEKLLWAYGYNDFMDGMNSKRQTQGLRPTRALVKRALAYGQSG